MLFSSVTFLFGFLPLCLALYHLAPQAARNTLLLLLSLLFYAWGEGPFILVMAASIVLNWASGLLVQRAHASPGKHWVVGASVAANLMILASFKYANFIVESFNHMLAMGGIERAFSTGHIHLPIGISFFTFHGLSYVLDVHRGKEAADRNLMRVALYISLFPQLVAGPIVRYIDIARQLRFRQTTLPGFASGVERFIVGLGKKVLLANTFAVAADQAFTLQPGQLGTANAWVGIAAYTLQIYFDFSGYSDMAIGLARMFGFDFRENFDHPYISRSVTEFWRRWHISLSTWFRDYLYIPLGGNRAGPWRTYANLAIVFFLCGLWHGASWNFVIWGMLHGAFLIGERMGLGKALAALPASFGWLARLYTLLVVAVAWVFFRSETLAESGRYLQAMCGGGAAVGIATSLLLTSKVKAAFAVGILACTPVRQSLVRRLVTPVAGFATAAALLAVFWLAAASLTAGSHNPFIYFRF